jgi:hypothetical protein
LHNVCFKHTTVVCSVLQAVLNTQRLRCQALAAATPTPQQQQPPGAAAVPPIHAANSQQYMQLYDAGAAAAAGFQGAMFAEAAAAAAFHTRREGSTPLCPHCQACSWRQARFLEQQQQSLAASRSRVWSSALDAVWAGQHPGPGDSVPVGAAGAGTGCSSRCGCCHAAGVAGVDWWGSSYTS